MASSTLSLPTTWQGFSNLPMDVFMMLPNHLETHDLATFRLLSRTCSVLAEKRLFHTIPFSPNPASFEKLLELGSSRLRFLVKELHFKNRYLPYITSYKKWFKKICYGPKFEAFVEKNSGNDGEKPSKQSVYEHLFKVFHYELGKQEIWIRGTQKVTDLVTDQLRTQLANFPNLRSLILLDSLSKNEPEKDPQNIADITDIMRLPWVRSQIQAGENIHEKSYRLICSLLLDVVGRLSSSRGAGGHLEKLTIIQPWYEFHVCLSENHKNFGRDYRQLKNLTIVMGSEAWRENWPGPENRLRAYNRFISQKCTNLKELTLENFQFWHQQLSLLPVGWFSGSRLQTIVLTNVAFTPEVLLEMLKGAAESLRTLEIDDARCGGNNDDYAYLFREMRKLLSLRKFRLAGVLGTTNGQWHVGRVASKGSLLQKLLDYMLQPDPQGLGATDCPLAPNAVEQWKACSDDTMRYYDADHPVARLYDKGYFDDEAQSRYKLKVRGARTKARPSDPEDILADSTLLGGIFGADT